MANRRTGDRGALRAPAREVAVYTIKGHTRSRITCEAMAAGIAWHGDKVHVIDESRWKGTADAQVAVFYGLEGNTPAIFEHYRTTPGLKAVYIDLGYWGRREGGRFTGYHKIVVNNRHPNAYLMEKAMPPDRFQRFGVTIKPPRQVDGKRQQHQHILLAGMGDKGAIAEGYQPEEWERAAIRVLRQYTTREIVYRPKPSWKTAGPIEDTRYSHRDINLEVELADCWAVFTHHSNVAVDAVIEGIPVYCEDGAGTFVAFALPESVEQPYIPKAHGREQWAANLAYCQWSIAEMKQGLPWQHLKTEGLV